MTLAQAKRELVAAKARTQDALFEYEQAREAERVARAEVRKQERTR
jgi:hypothetical protein